MKVWFISFLLMAQAPQWEISIYVESENLQQRLSIGQMEDASDGYDIKYDVMAILDTTPLAYFFRKGWSALTEYFWRDIRSTKLPQEWAFTVNLPPGKVRIKWDEMPFRTIGCNRINLYIEDTYTGSTYDMVELKEITYSPLSQETERDFNIHIEEDGNVAGRITGLSANVAGKRAVILTWKAIDFSPDIAIKEYIIKRREIPTGKVKTFKTSLSSYLDGDVHPGLRYEYSITPVASNGCIGDESERVNVDLRPVHKGKR